LGLLFYGLIPLLGAARHDGRFWELLHQKFGEQHFFLTRIPWNFAAIAGLMTLVPLIFARIEWPSCEGDTSPGAGLTRILFRVLNLECLAVGLLMFFDVKIIPSLRSLGLGVTVGMPNFLSFYYLAALIVGYFSGCVLRVFGMNRPRHWLLSWSAPFALLRLAEMDGAPRLDLSTRISRVGNGVVVGLLWMAAIGLPAMLFRDNFPQIRDFNGPAVAEFGKEMAKGLPATPAIVLADDPDRLYLAMGSSQRLGLPGPYVFIERQALAHGEYLRYLAERYPAFHKELVNPDRVPETLSDQHIGVLLAHLARRQPVYYLHPSFGNSFEAVCMTPRRLGGDLHPCPANALATLVLTPEEIATNQAYWHAMEKETLASLPWLAKRSPDALQIANYYSQILDYWGTELQKTSTRRKLPLLLEDANAQFVEALRLKPNNLVAKANQQYNEHLRGVPPAGAQISTFFVAAQLYNRWDLALDVYGPADVPDLDIQIGRYCAQHGSRLQAAHLFQRSLELAPNNPVGELDLGNTYVDLGLVEAASDIIADMHKRSTGNRLAVVGAEALGFITKHDFAQADQLLADAHRENPADAGFTGVMAEIYRLMGDRVLRESKGDAARKKSAEKTAAIWFKKALTALDEHSQLLHASTANLQEITLVNLRRAEMQRMLAKD
jgi:tetratricopeptide (TPR) repeat protein